MPAGAYVFHLFATYSGCVHDVLNENYLYWAISKLLNYISSGNGNKQFLAYIDFGIYKYLEELCISSFDTFYIYLFSNHNVNETMST